MHTDPQFPDPQFPQFPSHEVVGWDWSNGAESGTASLTLNAFGQLTAASTTTMDLTVSQNFSYDGEGRLEATGQVVANVTRNASVTYNANGKIFPNRCR